MRPGPFWQRKRQPIDLVGELRVPVLYVHGDRDWTVRPWHSRRLYEATAVRKRMVMIPGGPHAEYLMRPGKGREIFLPAVRAWLAEDPVGISARQPGPPPLREIRGREGRPHPPRRWQIKSGEILLRAVLVWGIMP